MPNLRCDAAQREFERFISQHRDQLVRSVQKCFPRLLKDSEDLVQQVIAELWQALVSRENDPRWHTLQQTLVRQMQLHGDWPSVWRWVLQKRLWSKAMDTLRQMEYHAFIQLGFGNSESRGTEELPGPGPTPDRLVEEASRRWRQVVLLSDILREFVQYCENPKQKAGLQMKEVYERRLRGGSVEEIERSMGMTRNHVDQTIKRARDWIRQRVQSKDVHRSVFLTLLGQGARQPTVTVCVHASRYELQVSSFEDVLRFVVNEMGALCPSEERLLQYAHQSADQRFRDVRYHVEEAGCQLCQEALQLGQVRPVSGQVPGWA